MIAHHPDEAEVPCIEKPRHMIGKQGIKGKEEDEREEKPPHRPPHCLEHKGPKDDTEHKGKQRRRNLPTLKQYIFTTEKEIKGGNKT